jgi:hypothetical protein
MRDKPSPLFLERRSYRQRRLVDAARLLPLAGALLWLVPLLWPQGGGVDGGAQISAVPTSSAMIYIFGIWIILVLSAMFLSAMLDHKSDLRDLGDKPDSRDK